MYPIDQRIAARARAEQAAMVKAFFARVFTRKPSAHDRRHDRNA